MIYQKASIKNGQVVIESSKEINQASLTSDCWTVQFEGLTACKKCQYKGTDDCGGGATLKSLKKINRRLL